MFLIEIKYFLLLIERSIRMKNFTVKLSKSYDFDVKVEARSAEEAKKLLVDTPFEKLTKGCDFSEPTLAIKDVVLNDFDPRFYKDDNKL
tara:strand:- start:2567 stop:2833 length:267 start_codon:yes stop_codon:yes gene_type:complete